MNAAGMVLASLLPVAFAFQGGALPEGKGKATLERACTGCHDVDAVTASHYTEMGWKQTVDDMISRGAEASGEQVAEIVAYLTKFFGKLNVNTATQAQLQNFLGLAERDAKAIIAYREHSGLIKDMEQLKSVPEVNAQKLQEKSALIAFAQ